MHITKWVFDDLSEAEAYDFYLDLIRLQLEKDLFQRDPDSFKQIFHLTGGRMMFIRRFVDEAIALKALPTGGHDPPIPASRLCATRTDLIPTRKHLAFLPPLDEVSSLRQAVADPSAGRAADGLRGAISMIAGSGSGHIRYAAAVDRLGRDALDALIAGGRLYLRQASAFPSSAAAPPCDAVMPGSVPALRAMEIVAREHAGRQLHALGM